MGTTFLGRGGGTVSRFLHMSAEFCIPQQPADPGLSVFIFCTINFASPIHKLLINMVMYKLIFFFCTFRCTYHVLSTSGTFFYAINRYLIASEKGYFLFSMYDKPFCGKVFSLNRVVSAKFSTSSLTCLFHNFPPSVTQLEHCSLKKL